MRKVPLYSRSDHSRSGPAPVVDAASADAPARPSAGEAAPAAPSAFARRGRGRAARLLAGPLPWVGATAVLALLLAQAVWRGPAAQKLTQKDIDAAVLHTLETKTLPSPAARAYEAVRRSVVLVRGQRLGDAADVERSVGSGVVIVDSGIILTNLHVVAGADKIGLRFADGTESEASLLSVQTEHDLAVLQAKTLPDDLQAATMRSTGDLAPGDQVVAVGFPFGIGPSVSAGVISGLKRDYLSPQGKRVLTNLIQFDAAANPGNSGGPLVTMDGEVVGIVTAILNPSEQRTFIGIAFAVPIENAAAGAGLTPF
jgi:S1-C subfamily serine protease